MAGEVETYELEINDEIHYILLRRLESGYTISYRGCVMAHINRLRDGFAVRNCGETHQQGVFFKTLEEILDIVADHIAQIVLGE